MEILHARMTDLSITPPRSLPCSECDGQGDIPEAQRAWMEHGRELIAARLDLLLGLREAAHRLNITPTQLSQLEVGKLPNTHLDPRTMYPRVDKCVLTAQEIAYLASQTKALRLAAEYNDQQVVMASPMGYDESAFYHEQRASELRGYAARLEAWQENMNETGEELPQPPWRRGTDEVTTS